MLTLNKVNQVEQESPNVLTAPVKSHSRAANYTIQGFIYQFNVTLLNILDSSDEANVAVEGPIEDIDVVEPRKTTAIQCKYHESQTKFSLSIIYKPILQMMNHFHHHPDANIRYLLWAYFPDIDTLPQITVTDMMGIFNTTDKDLQNYVSLLKDNVDVDKFHGYFSLKLGQSLDAIERQIEEKLKALGFGDAEIPSLIYPNAIHYVANLSKKRDAIDRVTSKAVLLAWLHKIKTTTISRWTLALKTTRKILEARKKQLGQNLSRNVRRRTFLISETAAKDFKDFDDNIVRLVYDYINTYHHKVAHTEPPLFCFDCDQDTFDDLRWRIHQQGIRFNDGCIGPRFDPSHFKRPPMTNDTRNKQVREFQIRLARYETDPLILNSLKCDDFFLISMKEYPQLELKDINKEYLSTETFQQIRFLLGISNDYE